MTTDLNEGLVSEHEKNYWKRLRGDVRLHTEEQTDKAYHMGRDMPNNSIAMLASRLSIATHPSSPSQCPPPIAHMHRPPNHL
jgi:hypothetical protein